MKLADAVLPTLPDWPIPTVPDGTVLLPFNESCVFWPVADKDGNWKGEFRIYIQIGTWPSHESPSTSVIADENPEITQQRVSEAGYQILSARSPAQ
jgi:hypothetical protein